MSPHHFTQSRSSLIPYRRAADLPALLSDAANERFILRKDCEAVGSLVPEICRQKSTFPGPPWKQFPERNRGTVLFGGLHAKPVTSLLRTLRAYARSQGFWLQAAAAWGSSERRDISERGAPPPLRGTSPLRWGGFGLVRSPHRGGVALPAGAIGNDSRSGGRRNGAPEVILFVLYTITFSVWASNR